MTAGDYDPNVPQYGQPGGYPPPGAGGVPGGVGIRFGARLIDGIIVGIVVSILVSLVWDNYSLSFGIFSGILLFVYFLAFEVTQGWTPGKKLLGLHVRGVGLPKPTPKESAIRNAFLLLGIIPFIGGLLVLAAYIYIAVTINSSPTKQGKHDQLAGGTQVLKG